MKPLQPFLPLLLSLIGLYLHVSVSAISLSTNSRWIVNESGTRFKLACINWPSHLQTMLAEGLDKQPVDVISKSIASRGFNCVRLTYAIFMLTNDSLSSLKVRESFEKYNLTKSIKGIEKHNPSFLNLTLIQAYKTVVSNLEENNVMVILDNHVSEPGWCCAKEDGNGFFGDKYFNPYVWIEGLKRMATMFNGKSNVVGMSLRNELRGPNQTVPHWYKYMQMGAEAVHKANPKVLVVLSGLYFDNDLSFLSNKQVKLSFKVKLVFEVHWYSFSNSKPWSKLNMNQACGKITKDIMRKAGFLVDQGWPLFMSEFGVDNRGISDNDNRYLGCVLGLLAELDLDWALWTLPGSFYFREGVVDMDETYAILNHDWSKTRNSTILRNIQAVQQPFRGINSYNY
ncbi:hypothetical protein LUZ60_004352 [Juncus effusus]|nr:hypothetical protein LUZ60_004352 [Juncus effusus]